jgi:MSHA biogenesis protein MshQ
VTQGCAAGSFTYSAQPFDLTVTARNSTGGATLNYNSDFAKAVALSEANGVTGGTLVPAGIAAGTFNSGVASLARSDATPPTYRFTRTTPDHAPATIRLRATDGEASSATAPGTEGTALVRIGRLRLSNAYGSLSPLIVPVERQYWTGNSWIRNADDSCTTLVPNNVSLSPSGWAVSIIGGNIQLVPTGPGSVTVCADLSTDHGVTCTATSAALPWLQSRWPGAATWDNDPSATATFGVFSPEGRRGIYNREMY